MANQIPYVNENINYLLVDSININEDYVELVISSNEYVQNGIAFIRISNSIPNSTSITLPIKLNLNSTCDAPHRSSGAGSVTYNRPKRQHSW